MPEQIALGQGPQNVVIDQLEYLLLLRVLLQTGILDVSVHHNKIFLALAGQRGQLVLSVGGHVLQQ